MSSIYIGKREEVEIGSVSCCVVCAVWMTLGTIKFDYQFYYIFFFHIMPIVGDCSVLFYSVLFFYPVLKVLNETRIKNI